MSIVLVCAILLFCGVESAPENEPISTNRTKNESSHSWLNIVDFQHNNSDVSNHDMNVYEYVSNAPGSVSKSDSLNLSSNHRNNVTNFDVQEDHVFQRSAIFNSFNSSSRREPNWDTVMQILKSSTISTIESLNLTHIISAVNITDECKRSLHEFLAAFSRWEKWAVQMADANAKLPVGMLEGTSVSLGSYDECLKIRFNSGKEQVKGRYCLVGYNSPLLNSIYEMDSFATLDKKYEDNYGLPPEWIEDFIKRAGPYLKKNLFWMGTCVPSTCSEHDVRQLTSHVTRPLGLNVSIADCQVDEPKVLSLHVILALSFLSILAILCTLGTVIDIVARLTLKEPKSLESKCALFHWIRVFSLYLNTEKCFQCNTSRSNLTFFNGLRFISFMWIVLNHTWGLYDDWGFTQYSGYLGMDDDVNGYVTVAIIDGAHIAVDTFFYISGFLLVYSTWKRMEASGGKLNILKFACQKYWRLTPSLGLTVSLAMIMYQFKSGPIWNYRLTPFMEACKAGVWQNFLFIHNWSNNPCLGHTWFLSALFQLHLVGAVILWIVYRWRIAGILLGISLAVGSVALIAFMTIWMNLLMPAYFAIKDLDFKREFIINMHMKTYSHFNSYFIGMAVGYLFLTNKEKKKRIKMCYQIMFWLLAAVLAFYVIYGKYYSGGSREVEIFYCSIHRTAWALSLAWLSYTCAIGHGGFVNSILSWPGFVLLSNISYLAYLLQSIVLMYINGSLRDLKPYSDIDLIFEIVKVISVSCILSVIAYIAVELPFSAIGEKLFKRR